MLVFIDESGDAGFKIGSSEFLLISLVIFDDYTEADKTRQIIKDVAKLTGQKPEFKFSRCNNANKDAFFQAIRPCRFRIRYVCIEKRTIRREVLRDNPMQFYNYTLKTLIADSNLTKAKICIDGNGRKVLNIALRSFLRKYSEPNAIDKLKFADSKTNELIQLADMIASVLARPYNSPTKKEVANWTQAIKGKIDKKGGSSLL
jgi:hypothetical protein